MTVSIHNHAGKSFVVGGRKHPEGRALEIAKRALHARHFLNMRAISPPVSADYTAKALKGLAQMYGNDSLGDCVEAGVGHAKDVWRSNGNGASDVSPQSVIGLYSRSSGYINGDPATDQGSDIPTVLEYLRTKGFAGTGNPNDVIVGYLKVDPSNLLECKSCLWLFENLIPGVDLPAAYIHPFPSANGFHWPVAGPPVRGQGHCPPLFGYNQNNQFDVSTWALIGEMDYAAVEKYCAASAGGELWTALSAESLDRATHRAANGLNRVRLQAAMKAFGDAVMNIPI